MSGITAPPVSPQSTRTETMGSRGPRSSAAEGPSPCEKKHIDAREKRSSRNVASRLAAPPRPEPHPGELLGPADVAASSKAQSAPRGSCSWKHWPWPWAQPAGQRQGEAWGEGEFHEPMFSEKLDFPGSECLLWNAYVTKCGRHKCSEVESHLDD